VLIDRVMEEVKEPEEVNAFISIFLHSEWWSTWV